MTYSLREPIPLARPDARFGFEDDPADEPGAFGHERVRIDLGMSARKINLGHGCLLAVVMPP
jgi:hypothetical protein